MDAEGSVKQIFLFGSRSTRNRIKEVRPLPGVRSVLVFAVVAAATTASESEIEF